MKKKILLYFGDHEEKQAFVERVLHDMNIPYQVLCDDDLHDEVGYLMELDGFQKHDASTHLHYESDLMILKDIEDEEIQSINTLLQAFDVSMRKKAMLTKHNQHWSVASLLLEIEKEHQYFSYVENIRTLLQQSSTLVIEEYTTSSWKAYEAAFVRAYESISKENTLEEVMACYQAFASAKEALEKVRIS